MTPQELLGKAVEVIERDGWHQGSMYENSDETWPGGAEVEKRIARHQELGRTAPVCAMGAVYRAAVGTAYTAGVTGSPKTMNLIRQSFELLGQAIVAQAGPDHRFYGIAGYNDDDRTTKEDVILAMKTAAAGG